MGTSAPDAGAIDTATAPSNKNNSPPNTSPPDGGTPIVGTGICSDDLSNIGTNDFAISFDLSTTQTGQVAVLNQRDLCNTAVFWDVQLVDGKIQISTDDTYVLNFAITPSTHVNDGVLHSVKIQRASEVITIYVDGNAVPTSAPDGGGTAMSIASFGALPPLAIGVDTCDGRDATVPFVGTLKNVCITPAS
jgi:hypothetical protein